MNVLPTKHTLSKRLIFTLCLELLFNFRAEIIDNLNAPLPKTSPEQIPVRAKQSH